MNQIKELKRMIFNIVRNENAPDQVKFELIGFSFSLSLSFSPFRKQIELYLTELENVAVVL